MTRLADTDDALGQVRELRMTAGSGLPVVADPSLPVEVRAPIDAAQAVGAPLLPMLDAVGAGLRADREVAHAVGAAAAPARLVATALTILPAMAVPLLGRLTGTDVVAFYRAPVGQLVGAFGVLLWVAGAVTTTALIRRAGTTDPRAGRLARPLVAGVIGLFVAGPVVGLIAVVGAAAWFGRGRRDVPSLPLLPTICDVMVAGLSVGLSVPAALRLTADRLPEAQADLRQLALQFELGRPLGVAGLGPLTDLLTRAHRFGSPLVPALSDLAAQLRADRLGAALADAQRLPTRLTFPAALFLLPATLLLAGAPMVAAGLAAVTGT